MNNKLFNISYAMLRSPESLLPMMTPSNFVGLKKQARIHAAYKNYVEQITKTKQGKPLTSADFKKIKEGFLEMTGVDSFDQFLKLSIEDLIAIDKKNGLTSYSKEKP